MNKKILAILGLILITALGGGMYLLSNERGREAKDSMVSAGSEEEGTLSVPATPDATPGSYVDYSDTAIADAKGTKLLFFHAPWCPQCRALDDDIRRKGVPEGATIIKVDYDSNQSLRQKYGVTVQTTIVRVDDTGNLIKKYVAYDEPTLASLVKNLL